MVDCRVPSTRHITCVYYTQRQALRILRYPAPQSQTRRTQVFDAILSERPSSRRYIIPCFPPSDHILMV